MSHELNISDFDGLKAWKDKKWVVLTPTGQSELGDILMEVTPHDLALQIFGGLEKNRIFLVTDNKEKAAATAKILIDLQTGATQDRLAKLEEAVIQSYAYLSTRPAVPGDGISILTNKLYMLIEVSKMGKST